MSRSSVPGKVQKDGSSLYHEFSAVRKGLVDGLVAILISFLAQFLIVPLQLALSAANCPFPAQILAMFLVFAVLYVVGRFHSGVDKFYARRLQGPAAILNKHMSIGFTIPFLMIVRSPSESADTIGFIVACFVFTGFLNMALSYSLSFYIQTAMERLCNRFSKRKQDDTETGLEFTNTSIGNTTHFLTQPKVISEASSMVSTHRFMLGEEAADGGDELRISQLPTRVATPTLGYMRDVEGTDHGRLQPNYNQLRISQIPTPAASPIPTQVEGDSSGIVATLNRGILAGGIRNLTENLTLWLCWLVTVTVALPVRQATGKTVFFDTFLLFSVWLSIVALQASFKSEWSKRLCSPGLRIFCFGCLNPVLLTTLAMMGYVYLEASRTGTEISAVLDTIQTNASFADFVFQNTPAFAHDLLDSSGAVATGSATGQASAITLGAGDIAQAILNSGLISWGLRLYECRSQLLSRAGTTVFLVSTLVALLNVVVGPLLASHAMGLGAYPGYALAFAARGVTLALGTPALAMLGGDQSLNAVMVIVSGILFQMGLGFGLDRWIGRLWERYQRRLRRGDNDNDNHQGQSSASSSNVEVNRVRAGGDEDGGEDKSRLVHDPATVAGGVTVGVNSAAMGTAHLYEESRPGAPYSALSMIVHGVMTVVFCSIHSLAAWVVTSTSG